MLETHPEGSSEDTIAELYLTATDTKARDKNKLSALSDYFKEIDKVSNLNEYMALVGKLEKEGINSIFSAEIYPDVYNNMKKNTIWFFNMNTIVKKEFYDNKDYADIVQSYKELLKKLLVASGESKSEADAHIAQIIKMQNDLEVNPKEEYPEGIDGDIEERNPEMTKDDFKKIFTNVDITTYLDAAGYGNLNSYCVKFPKHLGTVNGYLKDENLAILKEYVKMSVLFRYAPFLTTDIYKSYADFQKKIGESVDETIEDTGFTLIESLMNWDVAKLYAQKYVEPNGTKEKVTAMVNEMINQYYKDIEGCTWMTAPTKANAKKKQDKLAKNICYPEDWTPYVLQSDLKSPEEGGNIVENMKMIHKENRAKKLKKLEDTYTLQSNKWEENPLEVNAFYSPGQNAIFIPFGICGGIFYDDNRSKAENYACLGTVIGHEISHGFDPDGSRFDENGDWKNWWTQEDTDNYQKIQNKMIDYYNTFELLEGQMIYQDGVRTLGENVADLAGISCAIKLIGNDKETRDTFFKTYTHLWAEKMSDEITVSIYIEDEHSKPKTRVNAILSMLDEFYETYDVTEKSAMYVAPENRIKIWY